MKIISSLTQVVYNPTKKKVLTVFDDIIVDMEANKELRLVVTELFMRQKSQRITLHHDLFLKCLKI